MFSLIEGADWADRFAAGWLLSAIPSARLWKSCRGRYGLASEHRRAGRTCLWWHCQSCPLTTNNLCCVVGRSEVFGGGGVCLVVVVVREGLEKRENRWREVVKTAPYPLLSCFLSVSSSTPPMLPKVGKEIKAGRHERHPWDSVFFGALSLCSLRYRYGNAESWAQPVPRLQRMPGLIRLSLSLCFFSRPPPRLTPSSSSASIRCSCLSQAALRLPGR